MELLSFAKVMGLDRSVRLRHHQIFVNTPNSLFRVSKKKTRSETYSPPTHRDKMAECTLLHHTENERNN